MRFALGIASCIFAVVCVGGCSKALAPLADEYAAREVKALIPKAAGIPGNELRRFSEGVPLRADFRPPNGDSLTWAVFTLWVGPEWRADPSVFFLGPTINPCEIAGLMAGPTDKDGNFRPYATLIHPEYITDYTCKVDGDTAIGAVSFKAEKVYEGKAEYTARKKDGKWRIEEFRMPALMITVALGPDGKWVKK